MLRDRLRALRERTINLELYLKHLARSKLWGQMPLSEVKEYSLCWREDRPFIGAPVEADDPRIVKSFTRHNSDYQYEYIIRYSHKALIEPNYGWVIANGAIIPESLPYSRDFQHVSPLLHKYLPLPSLRKCLKAKSFDRANVEREPCVISLRDAGEGNYWHFYNDVLSKLVLLEKYRIATDAPVVVAKSLYAQPYFQSILKRSRLQFRRLIVQDDFYVEAEETVFCKAMPYDRTHFFEILDYLNISEEPKQVNERVFLVRNLRRGRFIANFDEVKSVCDEYGFRMIDTEELDLEEQIRLFSQSRYVIGVHGSGLTNIIYRRNGELSLLEVFPPGFIPPHFYWLTTAFRFKYQSMMGVSGIKGDADDASENNGSGIGKDGLIDRAVVWNDLVITPNLLRSKIEEMLR